MVKHVQCLLLKTVKVQGRYGIISKCTAQQKSSGVLPDI